MAKKIKLPMEEIISYYESGMTTAQLGEKYGVGKDVICNRLRENGVKIRPSRSMKRIDLPVEEIISEYQSGMNITKLAEKYGVNHNVIHKRLRENGVKIRSKKINLPVEEIISEYQSGMNIYLLADKYGVSKDVIYRRLRDRGIIRTQCRNLPIEEIISEYQSGMTTYQLADKYGVSDGTINNRLKKNGVKIRPPRGESKIDLPIEEIISEYQSGMNITKLADKYGVCKNTIYRRLKENGVEKNA